MAQDRPQNTELTTQYATQVATDLAHNAQEQERVNAELLELQGQLEALRDDRTVLVAIRDTLVGESAPATTTGTPKRKATAKPGTAKPAQAPAPRTKPTPDPAQPTLGSLIREHLSAQGAEPRSTAEITQALAAAHPDRGVKNTVVRTTIEGLVAKGHVQRHKQGGSVFYTTATAAEAEPAAEAAPEPDAPAEETATPEVTAAVA